MKRKGLGHAIYQSKDWINTTFITLLGDSFIEPKKEIRELIAVHRKNRPIASLLLFQVDDPRGYGLAKFKETGAGPGQIAKVKEKPTRERAKEFRGKGGYYAICGAYIFEPEIFNYIEKTKPGVKGEIQITDAISLAIKNGETVYGVVLKGKYLDIGKWKTILHTERELLNYLDLDVHIRERTRMMKKMKNHEENGGA
jgi:dTDP-glucose pyrophosphorylase